MHCAMWGSASKVAGAAIGHQPTWGDLEHVPRTNPRLRDGARDGMEYNDSNDYSDMIIMAIYTTQTEYIDQGAMNIPCRPSTSYISYMSSNPPLWGE